MEIDISIRNATPEELQRLFIGMQMTDKILGKPATVKKPKHVHHVKTKMPPATTPAVHLSQSMAGEPEPVPPTAKKKDRKMQSRTKLERVAARTKYQIPFDWKTQKKEYNRAWYLCKKYGKPYPEALALSQAAGGEKTTPAPQKPAKKTGDKQGGRLISCPYCKRGINTHGMHKHVKGAHPEKYEEWQKTPDRLQHGIHTTPVPVKEVKEIPATPAPEVTTESLQSDPDPSEPLKIIGAEGLSDALPESNPTNSDRRNSHMKAGDRVRHTRGNRLFAGIGTVKRSNLKSGEQLVAFANGMEWIPEKDLDVVPVEAKA